MSLPVVLRAEAEAEFDEAFDFYEGRRAGLGLEFLAEVQRVFDRIAANPQIHSTVKDASTRLEVRDAGAH